MDCVEERGTQKATITSSTSTVENEQSLPDNSYCRTGSELLEEFMKDTCPFISNNRQFVSAKGKSMGCTLCSKTIGPISNTKRNFERALLSHITSKEHFKLLNSLTSENEKMESVQELFVDSDINYFKVLFNGVKSHFLNEILNIGLHPGSRKISSNLEQKDTTGTLGRLSKSQNDECSHDGRFKVFGICKRCLKNKLKIVCPDLKNQFIYILVKSDNKCICTFCRTPFSSKDLGSFKTSYITHCESEEHKQRLNDFLYKKQKGKEKRKGKKMKTQAKDRKEKRATKKRNKMKK